MRKKKKIFIIISIILLLIIFKKPIDNIPIRRAITMKEAEHTIKTQEGYYIIQSTYCSAFLQYILYNKSTEGILYDEEMYVDVKSSINRRISPVILIPGQLFLVKGKLEETEMSNAMCPETYKLSVDKWELITPIERSYDAIFERKEYPTDYIDFYDLYHFDYKLF